MKKLLLIPLMLLSLTSFGQTSIEPIAADTLFPTRLAGDYFYEDKNAFSVSPYLLNAWTCGELLLNDGSTVSVAEMNYNAYLDQVLCTSPARAAKVLVDKASVKAFWLLPQAGNSRRFRRLSATGSTSPDFFAEELSEGKVSFYARRAMVYCRMEDVNQNGRMIQVRKIAAQTTYFVQFPDGRMLPVRKLGKKAFLELFPESRILTIKQKDGKKIDFRKEEGWTEAIIRMNQR